MLLQAALRLDAGQAPQQQAFAYTLDSGGQDAVLAQAQDPSSPATHELLLKVGCPLSAHAVPVRACAGRQQPHHPRAVAEGQAARPARAPRACRRLRHAARTDCAGPALPADAWAHAIWRSSLLMQQLHSGAQVEDARARHASVDWASPCRARGP